MNKTFTRLISQNYNVIYGPINEYIPEMWQKDVQNDIIIAAWQAWPSFKGESKFSTWLYKIALFQCCDWVRKEGARQRRHEEYERQLTLAQAPNVKRWPKLHAALSELCSSDRILLFQYYAYDIPVDKIADRLGITPNYVRQKIHRIKQQLTLPTKQGSK